jgi:hypothetical protein
LYILWAWPRFSANRSEMERRIKSVLPVTSYGSNTASNRNTLLGAGEQSSFDGRCAQWVFCCAFFVCGSRLPRPHFLRWPSAHADRLSPYVTVHVYRVIGSQCTQQHSFACSFRDAWRDRFKSSEMPIYRTCGQNSPNRWFFPLH